MLVGLGKRERDKQKKKTSAGRNRSVPIGIILLYWNEIAHERRKSAREQNKYGTCWITAKYYAIKMRPFNGAL